jgi:hypothetical protein
MPYDWHVEGTLAAFGRRPVAGTGLVIAAAWIALIGVECFAVFPWDAGGLYANTVEFADFAWRGVVGVAAFVWLLERAGA